MDKQAFRESYLKRRKALSENEVDERSLSIANKALEINIWDKTYYHIFLSIESKKEIDTSYLLHILQGRDKSIIVPKANFETGEMSHYLLQENTKLVVSKYGIPEPKEGILISEKQLDIVFVPLLAYDKSGNRIGYGKGFYDRFLAKCSNKCLFIGLSFFSPEEKVLYENIDIPLHYCITPEKIYSF